MEKKILKITNDILKDDFNYQTEIIDTQNYLKEITQ